MKYEELRFTHKHTGLQISTCDCGLDGKDLFVNYEEPLFSRRHTGLLSPANLRWTAVLGCFPPIAGGKLPGH